MPNKGRYLQSYYQQRLVEQLIAWSLPSTGSIYTNMFLFNLYVPWFIKHVLYNRIYSLRFTEAITIKTEIMKIHYYYKLTFCPEDDHDKIFLPAKKEKVQLIFVICII
jgi:hypothetical protein